MAEKRTTKANSNPAVLVTTAHRGVFFGYMVGKAAKEKIKLKRARSVSFWDTGMRGFLGLAESGPGDRCRVGPAVPELEVWDVTSVATCTPEAIDKMERGPWG